MLSSYNMRKGTEAEFRRKARKIGCKTPFGGSKKAVVANPITCEDYNRQGQFLARMGSVNARGPLKKNGEPTCRALSLALWGLELPENNADLRKLTRRSKQHLKLYRTKCKGKSASYIPK